MSEPKTSVYAIVDSPGRPLVREVLIYRNKRPYTDKDTGEAVPAECLGLDPLQQGFYIVNDTDMYAEEKLQVLERKVKRSAKQANGRVIGPFDSVEDAFRAKEHERPKTEAERLALAEARAAAAEAELATLKKPAKETPPKKDAPKPVKG